MGLLRSLGSSTIDALTTPALQRASLGDIPLDSGGVLRDCIIAYRTRGVLNRSRSNVVLLLPWFQGTSRQLARQIGPRKLVDSAKYFVIAVDGIGNGVSSSPSNSTAQPGRAFPEFTIRDMVESQHRLVTRVFGLTQLHAVVGTSMGGMQVFQWIVTHPGFMKRAVSIVGSPQSQSDDVRRWRAAMAFIEENSRLRRVSKALANGRLRTAIGEFLIRPEDYCRQGAAIAAHDISNGRSGGLTATAADLRTELLVAGAWTDADVNPRPGFTFAHQAGAEILELDGRCGHQAPSCDQRRLRRCVDRFLARGPSAGKGDSPSDQ
jgi:homoserine O-acetyltransferase